MPSDFELERAVEDFLQGDPAKFKKSFRLLIEPPNGHEEAPWPTDDRIPVCRNGTATG